MGVATESSSSVCGPPPHAAGKFNEVALAQYPVWRRLGQLPPFTPCPPHHGNATARNR